MLLRPLLVLLACFCVALWPLWAAALQLAPVVSGLSSPLFVGHAGDGSNRLFIVERGGTIRVLQPGSSTPTVFLDIHPRVIAGGEQGLLGLAFHPHYASNGRFFVDYTRVEDGATVIAEYAVTTDDPNVADPASETILLLLPQPFANHNGGMLAFGLDGYLYIGMGDGGDAHDPGNRAQNPHELLGKILRLDIDHPDTLGGTRYSSPPDNPYYSSTAGRDEIYALGLRNPWRFSFDRLTGQLYVADVGQSAREEVNIVTLGGNYGWRVYEGFLCTTNDPTLCLPEHYDFPLVDYAHAGGRCSITGGYVYRGVQGALSEGTYVYGDYCTGEIFAWDGTTHSVLLDTSLNLSSFGEDEAGELYVVGLSGTVQKLSSSGGGSDPAFVTSFERGPSAPRNDFTGWVGMKVTVGGAPITVQALGRVFLSHNTHPHEVQITTTDGTYVTSVLVPSGGTPEQITYEPLAPPVTLQPNQSYYIASYETAGQDEWYDWDTIVTHTTVATVPQLAFYWEGAWYEWAAEDGPNRAYVPVSFKYDSGSSGGGVPASQHTRWEMTLTSTKTYANPFTDVTVHVQYTKAGSPPLTGYGFWDGGSTFKLRQVFPEAGTWHYTTTATDASNSGLHNREGDVHVVPYTGTNVLYRHGFLQVSADQRFLAHADGTPFLWVADTLWGATVWLTEAGFHEAVADRRAKHFTVLQTNFARKNEVDTNGETPWSGDRWNVHFMQKLDRMFDSANDQGMYLFVNGLVDLLWDRGIQQYERLVEMIGARYAGHYVSFGSSMDDAYDPVHDQIHAALRHTAPWTLLAQHPGSADNVGQGNVWTAEQYYDTPLVDYVMDATGVEGNLEWACYNAIEWSLRLYNHVPPKPVVNAESWYEGSAGGTAEMTAQLGYLSLLSGNAGYTYGTSLWKARDADLPAWKNKQGATYMRYLYDFFVSLDNGRALVPKHNLIQNPAQWYQDRQILASTVDGRQYIVFMPNGGTITVDLNALASAALAVSWYNPLTGTYMLDDARVGGDMETFVSPLGNQMVVLKISKTN